MNFKTIVVFDTETTGVNPDECSAVQLAAIAIDPRNLTIIPGSELNLFMRPDPATINQSTLEWHARRLKMEPAGVLQMWEEYPDPRVIWPEFLKYLRVHHTKQDRQTMHSAPIRAGCNIEKFDMPIVNRYHEKYGDGKALFSPRDKIDLLDVFFMWFENNSDITSYAMDNMRDYFGISKDNAHDALQDVKDSAEMIIRFMKLHRKTAEKVTFKGAFSK